MAGPLRLVLDPGDVFTKGVAITGDKRTRLRFPSVVARRLLEDGDERATGLLLDPTEQLVRLDTFDAAEFPRSRSYPDAQGFRRSVGDVPGARFVGWQAVAHGADRQLLAAHPTAANIDAITRKALLLAALDHERVDVSLVVDSGAKAAAVAQTVSTDWEPHRFSAWTAGQDQPRKVELSVRSRVVDAAAAAVQRLPDAVKHDRLLVVDIGYRRTKLWIVSERGCEHQSQLVGLGVFDCVYRILRDEQERGLVEDEFAVIKALERSQTVIDIAGRSFEIEQSLSRATRALVEELAREIGNELVADFSRRAVPCPAVAVIGGGAAVVGGALRASLEDLDLGIDRVWIADDPTFLLVEGAAQLPAATEASDR